MSRPASSMTKTWAAPGHAAVHVAEVLEREQRGGLGLHTHRAQHKVALAEVDVVSGQATRVLVDHSEPKGI